jgi:hypothetical protein
MLDFLHSESFGKWISVSIVIICLVIMFHKMANETGTDYLENFITSEDILQEVGQNNNINN